ncbi:maltodextrin glucosidase [Vibrio salinus]|uniref:maltodextrin glucosidase n=1 Tax=Vibrio salinus TaxID=2899784 RepID=UPI001E433651|nr:maltodextrin glucosidase [Vibrio salinus]MCE0495184.1 maltodextrin glucosidase [Vibrio salinus]
MCLPFLYHGQSTDWVSQTDHKLTVRLAVEKAWLFQKILVRHEPDNEETLTEMHPQGSTEHLTFWEASFEINTDRDITHYAFKLLTGKEQFWLDAKGVSRRISPKETHFKYNAVNRPPEWINQQVFYQILPDRFCNGKPEISVRNGESSPVLGGKKPVAKQWGEPVSSYDTSGGCEFYGGDLYGVGQKIDYLQSLGITAIYLNPIFTAPSNHKYDTSDYMTIDPHLGTNEDFALLCKDLHHRKMKIILDAVFNHTSAEHPWFNKSGQHPMSGAYQSTESPYRNFYSFDGNSQRYHSWKGVDSLAVLNYKNKQLRKYIYQDDDAVIKHWLKPPYSIDGWRFDVIHMLGEGKGAKNNAHYVKAFRKSAKQVNPDCYILGEHFYEATQWLQGDQEDGSMNYYGFAHPVGALLTGLDIAGHPVHISVTNFLDWQTEARAKIPWPNQLAQLNQLDSHDTARFMERVKHNAGLFKLAAVLLFTSVGTPCLYYGTELGMSGGRDPDNRRCMPWDEVEQSEYISFFRQLIQLRTDNIALQKGDYVPLYRDDNGFAFARQFQRHCVICVFNVSQKTRSFTIPVWRLGHLNHRYRSPLTRKTFLSAQGVLTVKITPMSGDILIVCSQQNEQASLSGGGKTDQ